MKFLLDTNVIIPAEPTSISDRETQTPFAAELIGAINAQRFDLYVHPGAIDDLQRDKDDVRLRLRLELLGKYRLLPAPPEISTAMLDVLGPFLKGSNHEIDARLMASIVGNAVDFLVTNDDGIHRRSLRLGIEGRVLTVSDAIAMLHSFLPNAIITPPAVRIVLCHEIQTADPIFDSLRMDYVGFNDWFGKAQREHRQAFTITELGSLAAVAIVKHEPGSPPALKICTFKVAEFATGYRYGELLLKALLDYADQRKLTELYLTCFPKQLQLLRFLEEFGFVQTSTQSNKELVLTKSLAAPNDLEDLSPLDFNIRFGPRHVWTQGVDKYIVPIQPPFHRMLFPDLEHQLLLLPGEACGNSILKAYICRSSIKTLAPGSILMFYRSQDSSKIRAIGVVDRILRSKSSEEVARFVGKRTVYPLRQIEEICQSEAIAILFRYSKSIPGIALKELVGAGAIAAAPQQITKVRMGADEWIQSILGA